MKSYNNFINEFHMDKKLYNDYMKDLPFEKQIGNLKRGDKIIIKSETREDYINKPLIILKVDIYHRSMITFDKNDNIFKIDLSKPNDYKAELL